MNLLKILNFFLEISGLLGAANARAAGANFSRVEERVLQDDASPPVL